MKLNAWKEVVFESSSSKTPQFTSFAKTYRNHVKEQLTKHGLELSKWNDGHFYCSGFISNPKTGKMAYMSVSDVRYFPGEWHRHILMRTAQGPRDYTGGPNNYAGLDDIGAKLEQLTA